MSKFDNYLKDVGILAHFIFFVYLMTEHEYYVYGFIAFILGAGGFIYINFKHSFVSLKNPIASIMDISGVLLCSFLIASPICFLLEQIFDFHKSNVLIGIKILVLILLIISMMFNYLLHKERKTSND